MLTPTTIAEFVHRLGRNHTTATAYDTAWLAALPAPAAPTLPRFPASLAWVRAAQHPDGGWGGPIFYGHDQLLCTLRAVLTLHAWNPHDPAVAAGWAYLQHQAPALLTDAEPTIGFELIYPTLLAEAAARGLPLPPARLGVVLAQRAAKLAGAPLALAARRDLPLAVNVEGLGSEEAPAWARAAQEANGGIGLSPAATAFLLLQDPLNHAARTYLEAALAVQGDGGAPACFPLETFEHAWALYYLGHAWPALYTTLPEPVALSLALFAATRQPHGWAASYQHSAKEADTTGVVATVLGQAGQPPDPQVLYQYEEATHFRCYALERNPSVSANAHILDALHYAPVTTRRDRVTKLLRFFRATQQPGGYWRDKWHTSPYYATSQVILAATDWDPTLVAPALAWLVRTQHATGGWGWALPTVEETAYAVLALRIAQRRGVADCTTVLAAGRAYLWHQGWPLATSYPALWIHKALYTPVQVVQAAVLAALLATDPLSDREGGTTR